MTIEQEKTIIEQPSEAVDTTKIGIYTIYDCVLKQFGAPMSVPVSKVSDYFTILVNEVSSPYYGHESDFILNKIGDFNISSGEIEQHFIERVCVLDTFVNLNKRNLQTIIKTLNYLPQGYFKMPSEQKEAIQEQINKTVQKYVEDYVVPDLDISSEKIKSLQSTIDDYEQRLNIVK